MITMEINKMKLSEQLKQDHECGDFGKALEGYSEKAKEIEDLIEMCAKDMYSPSCRFKKSTALKMYEYVNKFNVGI